MTWGASSSTPGGLRIAVVLAAVFLSAEAHIWQYGHENEWPETCAEGKHQSPINLQLDRTVERTFNPLIFKNYEAKYKASLTNNGHSVMLRLLDPAERPSVRGGGLPHEYMLDHLHFHWESEHTIHSNRYPLEMHIVHFANKFNSTLDAISSPQGLAVIGVLYDVNSEVQAGFGSGFDDILKQVKDEPEMELSLTREVSVGDFLPGDTDSFFRYEGSLTTPPCAESVVWTVLAQPGGITRAQLQEFEAVRSPQGPLGENYRPLQELNGRVVTMRRSAVTAASARASASLALGLSAVLLAVMLSQ